MSSTGLLPLLYRTIRPRNVAGCIGMLRGTTQRARRAINKMCPLLFKITHPLEQQNLILQLPGNGLAQPALPGQVCLQPDKALPLLFEAFPFRLQRVQSLTGFPNARQYILEVSQPVLPG